MAFQPGPSVSNVAGTNNIGILNATVPPEGAKCVPIPIDLTVSNSVTIDFTLMTAQDKMAGVQSLYIDNSDNTEPVTFLWDGTHHEFTCPAGAQGTFPVISTNRPKVLITSDGAVALLGIFLNVPLPANVWFPAMGELTQGDGSAVTVITTGSVPINVWNPPPNGGGVIINPPGATESLFVDVVNPADDVAPGANGTTVELEPGENFIIGPNFGGPVSANAITNGHTFTAYGLTL